MHPSGIKFGLSQGLLELHGEYVVVSGPYLELMSEMAHRWILRRKRVIGLWDKVVNFSLQNMPYSLEGAKKRDYIPFYSGLDAIVLQTMMPIAEEVGMGHRWLKRHFDSTGLHERLCKDTRNCSIRTINEFWRLKFRKIHSAIVVLCKENAPNHLRHAELLTLCQFNEWSTPRELERMNEFSKSLFSEEFRKRIGWD
jgi:hypothetical protein